MTEGAPASGVRVLSDVASRPFVEAWLEISDPSHFWFDWRLAATLALLRDHGIDPAAPRRALEVGCGRGVLRAQFERATAWSIDGADLDRDSLERAPAGRGERLLYDVAERHPSLHEAYDCVILYDVLEHMEARESFLSAVLAHLRPGGHFLVNVPSPGWLFSRYDVAVGHHLRYDRAQLLAELHSQPVDVLETRFWAGTMVPLLALRKLVVRRLPAEAVVERGFRPPGAFVHAALRGVMRAELALWRRPFVGTSLLLLAQKRA